MTSNALAPILHALQKHVNVRGLVCVSVNGVKTRKLAVQLISLVLLLSIFLNLFLVFCYINTKTNARSKLSSEEKIMIMKSPPKSLRTPRQKSLKTFTDMRKRRFLEVTSLPTTKTKREGHIKPGTHKIKVVRDKIKEHTLNQKEMKEHEKCTCQNSANEKKVKNMALSISQNHKNFTRRKTTNPGQLVSINLGDNNAKFPLKSRPLVPYCDEIFKANSKIIDQAKQYSRQFSRKRQSDRQLIGATSNCQLFIESRGYIQVPLSHEEKSFPLAFSLLVYKEVWQAERLLRAIYSPQNYYCIHVDRKASDETFTALKRLAGCLRNLFLSSKRENVIWGSASVLNAELNCISDLWQRGDWKYFINLTGQEFPLYSNRQVVRILKAMKGANDIDGSVKRAKKVSYRFKYFHADRGLQKTKIAMRPAPNRIEITKGNVHIIASRKYIDFVLHDRVALDFYDWAKETGFPEEIFFSSLNYNPHLKVPGSYKGKIKEKDLSSNMYIARYKHWVREWPFSQYGKCNGMIVRGICIIGIGDLPKLFQRKEMFVNKFYQDFEQLALDCIEELQFNRTKESLNPKFSYDDSFYRNLPFVKNSVS